MLHYVANRRLVTTFPNTEVVELAANFPDHCPLLCGNEGKSEWGFSQQVCRAGDFGIESPVQFGKGVVADVAIRQAPRNGRMRRVHVLASVVLMKPKSSVSGDSSKISESAKAHTATNPIGSDGAS